MSKAKEQAMAFISKAKEYGFSVSCTRSHVCISRQFSVGDKEAFVECDMMAGSVLGLAPLKGGSVWGTDGGSIGGYAALKSGQFRMCKSGSGVNFLKALAKLI